MTLQQVKALVNTGIS